MAVKHQNRKTSGKQKPNIASVLLLAAMCLALVFLVWKNAGIEPSGESPSVSSPPSTNTPGTNPPAGTENPENPDDILHDFAPYAVDSTASSRLISGTGVEVDGSRVDSYSAAESEHIDFGLGKNYTALEGVLTFRGNNFRDGGSYGITDMVEHDFGDTWSVETGALTAPNGYTWFGSGWVGQPLIAKWPAETRKVMNMYDWAKNKDGLVEVIYATMDGYVYFLELETGQPTRDKLFLGYTFKGSGALDPRGYPILYIGSGYDSTRGQSRAFVVSLIDGSVLYEFGNDDSFALRPWPMFDGSPLVDAETDQLIYPGENGVLYIIKLGTAYDEQAGTLSINPSKVVKWRYNGVRTGNQYWLGMEASAIIWRGHIIMADNGGNLMCVNLNTLETVWAQDVLDDTNSTPVLELENGHPYIYISTSFHAGWRAAEGQTAAIPIWKIDAVTGEIVWQTDYQCHTVTDISGGVQGTIAVGKNNISDLVFVPISRTPYVNSGLLVALDKTTGEEVWRQETQMYAWSSPVIVYDAAGDGYLVYCTTGGYIYLFDGRTGKDLAHMDLGANIEASPAVFNNTVVVGSRGQKIWGIELI